MRVSLADVQRYARTLADLSDAAERRVARAIAQWMREHPDATVAECRELAIAVVTSAVERYGDAAATNAAKLYDETMALEGVDVAAATTYAGPDGAAIEGTVRRIVGQVGTPDGNRAFVEGAGRLAAEKVRRAASDTVIGNVERDARTRRGTSVRFARIPQRPDPCPYCVMLASRGFDYTSAESAAAGNHHNCTCIVMPGVKGRTAVDGYDPDEWYDQYLGNIAEGIVVGGGNSGGSQHDWGGEWGRRKLAQNIVEMQEYLAGASTIDELKSRMEECDEILRTSGMYKAMTKPQAQSLAASLGTSREAIEQRGRAFAAIDADGSIDGLEKSRRKMRYLSIREEPLLFYDSVGNRSIPMDTKSSPRRADYCCMTGKQRRDLKDYEIEGHGILARLGFDVVPIPTEKRYLPNGFPNIDLWMDGQFWELKTPQGGGSSLTKRINEGLSKWDRLHGFGLAEEDTPRIVIDNRFSTMSDTDAVLKLKTAMAVNEAKGFDDAIFISSIGKVTRLSV